MAGLPLQHHVLQNTVAAAVQDGGVLPPGVQHQLPLEPSTLFGIGTHVIGPLPAAQVLLHRLPVEEDHRHIRRLGLVHDDGGGGAVHNVDADDVVPLVQKAVHLLILHRLAALAVR